MLNIIKVILFIIVNIAGWYTIPILASVAAKLDFLPRLPPGIHTEALKMWFLGGGLWVWIICATISIGYFFTKNEIKNWLLLAPMYGTALYGISVLLYFNFIYTIS